MFMAEQNINSPACVGIIMDGNRRWARERNLPPFEGHRAGYKNLKLISGFAREFGIRHLVVYAFSTENWKRSQEEVGFLMDICREAFSALEIAEMKKSGARLRFIGNFERVAPDIRALMRSAEEETAQNEYTLWVALSYGGRSEILSAMTRASKDKSSVEIARMDEYDFSALLWSAEMPDPDIIIRTGGEQRLSNFLPWQSVYSELFFIKTYWPDFSRQEFRDILDDFAKRERRRGA
jgi:undecaprenyl diphosphate synthase